MILLRALRCVDPIIEPLIAMRASVPPMDDVERINLILNAPLVLVPWRVGRKVPRNIYAQLGAEPSDNDLDIGRMDTAALAEAVVAAHNLAV